MSLFASFVITWTIILLPPTLLRVGLRTTFTRPWAIAIAVGLMVANHVLLSLLGGNDSARPFLTLGAIACFVILRWETKASAADLAQASRIANGYESTDRDQPSPESSTAASVTPSPAPQPATVTGLAPKVEGSSAWNLKRGLLRIWIVLTVLWIALVGGRLAFELYGTPTRTLLVDITQGADPYNEFLIKKVIDSWKLRIQGVEPPPIPSDPSNPYVGIVARDQLEEVQAMERRVRPWIDGSLSRSEVESELRAIGINASDIDRSPAEAAHLAQFIRLAESAKSVGSVRLALFGSAPESKQVMPGLAFAALVAPPMVLFGFGLVAVWILAGFKGGRTDAS
ncbi:MAG: hypothetical protein O9327_02355 [Polaromonas sp.]|nr:hypothetical protein [Polaromonas sp.]